MCKKPPNMVKYHTWNHLFRSTLNCTHFTQIRKWKFHIGIKNHLLETINCFRAKWRASMKTWRTSWTRRRALTATSPKTPARSRHSTRTGPSNSLRCLSNHEISLGREKQSKMLLLFPVLGLDLTSDRRAWWPVITPMQVSCTVNLECSACALMKHLHVLMMSPFCHISQQYFYEYVFDELRQRPRQVCPYAVVSFQFKGKDSILPSTPLPSIRYGNQKRFRVFQIHI